VRAFVARVEHSSLSAHRRMATWRVPTWCLPELSLHMQVCESGRLR
jgi:hypothetical protein